MSIRTEHKEMEENGVKAPSTEASSSYSHGSTTEERNTSDDEENETTSPNGHSFGVASQYDSESESSSGNQSPTVTVNRRVKRSENRPKQLTLQKKSSQRSNFSVEFENETNSSKSKENDSKFDGSVSPDLDFRNVKKGRSTSLYSRGSSVKSKKTVKSALSSSRSLKSTRKRKQKVRIKASVKSQSPDANVRASPPPIPTESALPREETEEEEGKYKKLLELLDDLPEEEISLDILKKHGKLVEVSPNKQFVRYNELLGEGSFKKVYLAYDTKNGFEVAWNVVKMKNMKGSQQARVVQEMKILQTLSHESIMKFYWAWFDKESNTLAFITEVLSSGTLKDFIMNKPVRLRIIKRWCRHILNALIYLHEENQPAIIHRDLKCDNIFINGSSGEIRIGDLGLASWDRTGNAKSVLGTPEYMAPEMFEENYDEKVDIYAFGMCVLEMMCKETPYSECTSTPQIYRKVMAGEPPMIFHRLKEGALKNFILMCIKKNRNTDEDDNETDISNKRPNKSGRPSASTLKQHEFLIKTADNPQDEMLSGEFLKVETPEDNNKKDLNAFERAKNCVGQALPVAASRTGEPKALDQPPDKEKNRSAGSYQSLSSRASELRAELAKVSSEPSEPADNPVVAKAPADNPAVSKLLSDNLAAAKSPTVSGADIEPREDMQEQPVRTVGFGAHKFKVIDSTAPPVLVSEVCSVVEVDIPSVQHESETCETKDTSDHAKSAQGSVPTLAESTNDDNDFSNSLRWVIDVESQDLQKNEATSATEFNPVLKVYFEYFDDQQAFDRGDGSGAGFDFNSNAVDGSKIANAILKSMNLDQTEFKQLKQNFEDIKERYINFKGRHQEHLSEFEGGSPQISHFRYKCLNLNNAVTVKPVDESMQTVKPVEGPLEISPSRGERQTVAEFVDQLQKEDESQFDRNSQASPTTDNLKPKSGFAFINSEQTQENPSEEEVRKSLAEELTSLSKWCADKATDLQNSSLAMNDILKDQLTDEIKAISASIKKLFIVQKPDSSLLTTTVTGQLDEHTLLGPTRDESVQSISLSNLKDSNFDLTQMDLKNFNLDDLASGEANENILFPIEGITLNEGTEIPSLEHSKVHPRQRRLMTRQMSADPSNVSARSLPVEKQNGGSTASLNVNQLRWERANSVAVEFDPFNVDLKSENILNEDRTSDNFFNDVPTEDKIGLPLDKMKKLDHMAETPEKDFDSLFPKAES